jgi:hypothetical protein
VRVLGGHPDLPELVGALEPSRGLADLLYGGGEQADQRGDDGDHNQQFDQGEAGAGGSVRSSYHEKGPGSSAAQYVSRRV